MQKKNIEEYAKISNKPLRKEDSSYAQIPNLSRCIKNTGIFQGFLIEKGSKILFFLPLNYSELNYMFLSSVLPYLLQVSKEQQNTSYVFKTFGIKSSEISLLLKDFIKNKHNIDVVYSEYLLSGELIVNVPKKLKDEIVQNFIQGLYSKISPFVYSDSDLSMPELISSLLALTNKKLAFSEDFTCGKMTLLFSEQMNKVLSESYIVPNTNSKMKILGVDQSVFKKSQIDFNEIAYQMALGTLENSGADIVVSNCGDLENGEVFFAIGSLEGVHIFNQKVEGSLDQKITMATNAIFFQLIKKLKQNDFHLGQITV